MVCKTKVNGRKPGGKLQVSSKYEAAAAVERWLAANPSNKYYRLMVEVLRQLQA